MTGLEPVIAALLKAAAKPAVEYARRQESIVALLTRFGLTPKVPPRDFDTLYVYCLIQYCYGKPDLVVNFFRNAYIRNAFRESFETGDPRMLDREAENIIDWNDETHALGWVDYDPRREFAGFTATFNALVDRSRGAPEARSERKIDGLQVQLAELNRTLARVGSLDGVREVALAPAAGQHDPAGWLAGEARGWFDAIGFEFESHAEPSGGSFEWIIKVPARRRFDRVVVYGTAGEAGARHVEHAAELLDRHGADEAWVLAPRRISAAARAAETGAVVCYTLDELIDQDADFDSYLDWLEHEVTSREIDTRYVPVYCTKDEYEPGSSTRRGRSVYGPAEGGLDAYVHSWLADPSMEHLSVLGEFGTGKTWFTLCFGWQLAQRYRQAKRHGLPRPRLPILVPLRDYAKAVSVQSLFSEFFFRKHNVLPGGYPVFEYLNRSGRLLLIFDGFDEMASRVGRQERVNNFWELATVVVPGAKVLLTCRTEHFPEAREGRDLLSARLKASTQALTGAPPQFEVVDLVPFDDEQIRTVLGHITDPRTVGMIMGNDELRDLMRRPVMSELVLDALPEIAAGERVDLARVYLYAVRRKITRDIQAERTFTSLADKVYFLCELSWEMLSTDSMSLNYRQFPDRIRACFGAVVQQDKDLDHWHHDMLGQTMLIRNADGDYAPAHRSLLEFFVAYKFAAELGLLDGDFRSLVGADPSAAETAPWSTHFHRERPDQTPPAIRAFSREPIPRLAATFGSESAGNAVIELLARMLSPGAVAVLFELIRGTRSAAPDEVGYLGGNAAEVLLELDPAALRQQDLTGVNLHGAVLPTGADLTGVRLGGADLSETDFRFVTLTDADLRGAALPDELGLARHEPASVIWLPEGIVASVTDGRVLRWPWSGDRLGEPVEIVADLDGSAQVDRLPGTPYLMAQDGRVTRVLDLGSGRSLLGVDGADGGIVVNAEDYLGVLLFTDGAPGGQWSLHHLTGSRELGPVPIESEEGFDFVDPRTGRTRVLTEDGRLFEFVVSAQTVSASVVGRIELPDRTEFDLSLSGCSVEVIWAALRHADQVPGEEITLFDLDGRRLRSIRVALPDDDGRRWALWGTKRIAYAEDAGVAVVLTSGGELLGVRTDDGGLLWHDPDAAGAKYLALSPDGSRFAVTGAYGDLEVRSARTGAVLADTPVTPDVTGLRLSPDCLPARELRKLVQNGAIVAD